jgi:hypothetical protein
MRMLMLLGLLGKLGCLVDARWGCIGEDGETQRGTNSGYSAG